MNRDDEGLAVRRERRHAKNGGNCWTETSHQCTLDGVKAARARWCIFVLALGLCQDHFASPGSSSPGKFKMLVLAEAGGHHIEFTKAVRPWLAKCGEEKGFEVDYITNTV